MKLSREESWLFWEKIGSPKYLMAPMVNGSDYPFRLLALKYGTDLGYTPMLHSRLMYEEASYLEKFFPRIEPPIGYSEPHLIAQVCGNDPDVTVRGCKLIQDRVDAIDLNCGCPQGIAKRGGYGAYLLRDPVLLLSIVEKMVNELTCPVFVKIRIVDEINDFEGSEPYQETETMSLAGSAHRAKIHECQDCDFFEGTYPLTLKLVRDLIALNVAGICIHGRTAKNKGHWITGSNWSIAKYIASWAGIPIICNGSLPNKASADACLEYTKAAAVMSGEGILEDPSFFAAERVDIDELCLELCRIYKGMPKQVTKLLKTHIWHSLYTALQGSEEHRQALTKANSVEDIETVCRLVRDARLHVPKEDKVSWYYRHLKVTSKKREICAISAPEPCDGANCKKRKDEASV